MVLSQKRVGRASSIASKAGHAQNAATMPDYADTLLVPGTAVIPNLLMYQQIRGD